jgi:hypothetical protein
MSVKYKWEKPLEMQQVVRQGVGFKIFEGVATNVPRDDKMRAALLNCPA